MNIKILKELAKVNTKELKKRGLDECFGELDIDYYIENHIVFKSHNGICIVLDADNISIKTTATGLSVVEYILKTIGDIHTQYVKKLKSIPNLKYIIIGNNDIRNISGLLCSCQDVSAYNYSIDLHDGIYFTPVNPYQ